MNKLKYTLTIFLLVFLASTSYGQHNKYFFYHFSGRAVLSRTQGATWLTLQPGQPTELHPGDFINVEGNGKGEIGASGCPAGWQ